MKNPDSDSRQIATTRQDAIRNMDHKFELEVQLV